VTTKHPDDMQTEACPSCGQSKGWRGEGRQYNRRGLCNCEGPQLVQQHGKHFPHRVTHPYCDHHPMGFYNQARARGVAHDDIPAQYGGGKIEDESTAEA
jgi:hypothetical protein